MGDAVTGGNTGHDRPVQRGINEVSGVDHVAGVSMRNNHHVRTTVVNNATKQTDVLDPVMSDVMQKLHSGPVHVHWVTPHSDSACSHEPKENNHIEVFGASGSGAFTASFEIIEVEVKNNFCVKADDTHD